MWMNYTVLIIALGAGLLGALGGSLGCFAVLRRQSLLGDALSHAALPGIVLAYMLTSSQSGPVLLAGAAIAGLFGVFCMNAVVRTGRIKYDSALGVVLSVFFGFGIVLLTLVQKWPDAGKAGLDKFLFGQAATLLRSDVYLLIAISFVAFTLLVCFWKEFKLFSFDADYARSLGFSSRLLEYMLTGLIALAIVMGLQTVGVVLMSAVLVAPAAAARQWTDGLAKMVLIAGAIGMISGIGGAMMSSLLTNFPTGPSIVLILGGCVLGSLLFAPGRGIISNRSFQKRNRRLMVRNAVLLDMYELEQQHLGEENVSHSLEAIAAMSFGLGDIRNTLRLLEIEGYVHQDKVGQWFLSERGIGHVLDVMRQYGLKDNSLYE